MTSSKPKKLVPGPYSTTWSYISLAYNKNMADEEKYLHAFRRRVYNLHLIQISARYMHVWLQYFADKIWFRILVPGPGVGPGFYSFPQISESEIRLFADDCVCYREIKDEEDTMKLQSDIDRLISWARKWCMRFQPVKCNMMQLTRKRIKKIHASYTLEGTDLENVESIKYLGVTITKDLRWNTHVSNVCTNANRTLGFLRRNL